MEIRTNVRGALAEVPGHAELPPGVHSHERVLTLVVNDDSEKKLRRLPSLYFWNTLVHSDRDASKVRAALAKTVKSVEQAQRVPTYRFAACRYRGMQGLYGRDFHNRSAIRSKATRLGLEFSDNAFVSFHQADGTFESDDLGCFEAEFVILANHGDQLVKTRGAKLALIMTDYRMGMLGPAELRALIGAFSGRWGLAGPKADDIVTGLDDLLFPR